MPAPTLSARVTRSFVQHIQAAPAEVFALLCPEREREWLPGWQYRMIHSVSGVAEFGAVFATSHPPGAAIWVVAEYQPPTRIAFVRWQPDQVVAHIEITLGRHVDGSTAVCIQYHWTPTVDGGGTILAPDETEWQARMSHWEGSMNAWLASRPHSPR